MAVFQVLNSEQGLASIPMASSVVARLRLGAGKRDNRCSAFYLNSRVLNRGVPIRRAATLSELGDCETSNYLE
jgi:hypothetical protein